MAEVTLKGFQQEAVDTVRKEFKAGISSQLIHLPTGSGKTYIIAAIAKSFNQKTLIIAHRKELIHQAVDKIKQVWPEADIGICMGDINDIDHQIVVGSIQTCSQSKRLKQLKKKDLEYYSLMKHIMLQAQPIKSSSKNLIFIASVN